MYTIRIGIGYVFSSHSWSRKIGWLCNFWFSCTRREGLEFFVFLSRRKAHNPWAWWSRRNLGWEWDLFCTDINIVQVVVLAIVCRSMFIIINAIFVQKIQQISAWILASVRYSLSHHKNNSLTVASTLSLFMWPLCHLFTHQVCLSNDMALTI